MNKIDITKQYQTRDGREAIIHGLNGPNPDKPVIASINNRSRWLTDEWHLDGSAGDGFSECADLIEFIQKWSGEIWVRPDGDFFSARTLSHEPNDYWIGMGYRKFTATEQ